MRRDRGNGTEYLTRRRLSNYKRCLFFCVVAVLHGWYLTAVNGAVLTVANDHYHKPVPVQVLKTKEDDNYHYEIHHQGSKLFLKSDVKKNNQAKRVLVNVYNSAMKFISKSPLLTSEYDSKSTSHSVSKSRRNLEENKGNLSSSVNDDDDGEDDCESEFVNTWTRNQKCAWARRCTTTKSIVPYAVLAFCYVERPPFILFFFLPWAIFLFYLAGTVVDHYLTPPMIRIASILHISDSLAGCTLLAMANATGDLVGGVSLAWSNPDALDLFVGDVFGASLFLTTVVFGSVIFVSRQPVVELNRLSISRDIPFFAGSLLVFLCFNAIPNLPIWAPIPLIIGYVAYVWIAWHQMRKAQHSSSTLREYRELFHANPSAYEANLPIYETNSQQQQEQEQQHQLQFSNLHQEPVQSEQHMALQKSSGEFRSPLKKTSKSFDLPRNKATELCVASDFKTPLKSSNILVGKNKKNNNNSLQPVVTVPGISKSEDTSAIEIINNDLPVELTSTTMIMTNSFPSGLDDSLFMKDSRNAVHWHRNIFLRRDSHHSANGKKKKQRGRAQGGNNWLTLPEESRNRHTLSNFGSFISSSPGSKFVESSFISDISKQKLPLAAMSSRPGKLLISQLENEAEGHRETVISVTTAEPKPNTPAVMTSASVCSGNTTQSEGKSQKLQWSRILFWPIYVLWNLTIPRVDSEVNPHFRAAYPFCITTFFCLTRWTQLPLPVVIAALAISFAVSVSVFIVMIILQKRNITPSLSTITLKDKQESQSGIITAIIGVVMALFWNALFVGEVIEAILTAGHISNISNDILGLTILAWGNSAADLFANVAVSRAGHTDMGLTSAYGSPIMLQLFATPFVSCISLIRTKLWPSKRPKSPFHLGKATVLCVVAQIIISSIWGALSWWKEFKVNRYWSVLLLVAFILTTVITGLQQHFT